MPKANHEQRNSRLAPGRDGLYPSRFPVLRPLFAWWRLMRRWLNRGELTVRLLGLSVSRGTADAPGLILLQIDGFSRKELERAMAAGRMPFLQKLKTREGYRIRSLYSGQPATTPAVLGELFYGVPQAVPAFAFRDHRSGQVTEMLSPTMASTIEGELTAQGAALLSGGSAYCDIYSGGATEAQLCPGKMTWSSFSEASVWRKTAVLILNVPRMIRATGLLMYELYAAVRDVVTERESWRELSHELKFIPRRLLGNVATREWTVLGVETDALRGLPVIHANLLGYDENAHRRGPDTPFAHSTLPGIDRAIHRIWSAASSSRHRDYHVWLMSDHGQEHTVPYDQEFNTPLDEAVKAVWAETGLVSSDDEPTVVAIGPLGYIYCRDSLSDEQKDNVAKLLVAKAHVPLVLARIGNDEVAAWNNAGRFSMPAHANHVLAPHHPHLHAVAKDFTSLCSHRDAGTFLISGWRNSGRPVSFVSEHGAHGGPGPNETTGFAFLPPDAQIPDEKPFRASSLRQMAQAFLDRKPLPRTRRPSRKPRSAFRLVTYNVHSCVGLDGRLSPTRIARVLASLSPDVIALQEVDVCRARSGCVDQARAIADALEMELHFHAAIETTGEKYGNAILSRFPMMLRYAALLPGQHGRREPRGALWASLDLGEQAVDIVTTHLGLGTQERQLQMDELLGPHWLGHPHRNPRCVFCGDFNSSPRSRVYKRVANRFTDAQLAIKGRRPGGTWFSPFPLARLDHVFVSAGLAVTDARVAATRLARVASDHLPLVVDIEVPSQIDRGETHEIRATGTEPLRTLSINVPPALKADAEPLPAGRR